MSTFEEEFAAASARIKSTREKILSEMDARISKRREFQRRYEEISASIDAEILEIEKAIAEQTTGNPSVSLNNHNQAHQEFVNRENDRLFMEQMNRDIGF